MPGTEVDAEAGTANTTLMVDEHGSMTELVDEYEQHVEREQERDPRSQ
jgi:hypothetical protein